MIFSISERQAAVFLTAAPGHQHSRSRKNCRHRRLERGRPCKSRGPSTSANPNTESCFAPTRSWPRSLVASKDNCQDLAEISPGPFQQRGWLESGSMRRKEALATSKLAPRGRHILGVHSRAFFRASPRGGRDARNASAPQLQRKIISFRPSARLKRA